MINVWKRCTRRKQTRAVVVLGAIASTAFGLPLTMSSLRMHVHTRLDDNTIYTYHVMHTCHRTRSDEITMYKHDFNCICAQANAFGKLTRKRWPSALLGLKTSTFTRIASNRVSACCHEFCLE